MIYLFIRSGNSLTFETFARHFNSYIQCSLENPMLLSQGRYIMPYPNFQVLFHSSSATENRRNYKNNFSSSMVSPVSLSN